MAWLHFDYDILKYVCSQMCTYVSKEHNRLWYFKVYVLKFVHMCQNYKTSIIGKFPLYFFFYFGMKHMCNVNYSWLLNSRFELGGSSYTWIFFFNSKYCSIAPSIVGWIHTCGTVDMEQPNTRRVNCKLFKLIWVHVVQRPTVFAYIFIYHIGYF